jgi:tetratricopeptide (TPR) repeat protein
MAKRVLLLIAIPIFILFLTYEQGVADNIDYLINETKKNPSNVIAYNKLGMAYFNMAKYNKAIIEYKKALKIDSNLPHTYRNIPTNAK